MGAFGYLEELNMSFNVIDHEQNLFYCLELMNLKTLIVTGNPFSITGIVPNYAQLQGFMRQKGGELINETLNAPAYLRREASRGTLKQSYPVNAV